MSAPITIQAPVIKLLKDRMDWHDSNPDVGMGPFACVVLDEVLEEYGATLTDAQKDSVLKEYAGLPRR